MQSIPVSIGLCRLEDEPSKVKLGDVARLACPACLHYVTVIQQFGFFPRTSSMALFRASTAVAVNLPTQPRTKQSILA